MKFSRAALGRNPLQNTLIDSASMPIFGEPVTAHEAERLGGQQERIEAIMRDGYWHTLPALQKELKQKYGQLYSETSISARLRAMRKRGYTVTHERTRAGSNLYQYRAVKATGVTVMGAVTSGMDEIADSFNEEQANTARIEAAL